MSVDPILHPWFHRAEADGNAPVLPDGCCDLILCMAPGVAPRLLFSGLDRQPRRVSLVAGTVLVGARLRPGLTATALGLDPRATMGATVDLRPDRLDLSRLPDRADPEDVASIATALAGSLRDVPRRMVEVMAGLATARGVRQAAGGLGVSERTLYRLVSDRTGLAPSIWIDLARARRAFSALATAMPLAEIAQIAGYADQPHLTRSMRQWFGRPPAALRASPELMRLSLDPGFAGNRA